MKSRSAQTAKISPPSEKQKVTLLQQVLLQNTNINIGGDMIIENDEAYAVRGIGLINDINEVNNPPAEPGAFVLS